MIQTFEPCQHLRREHLNDPSFDDPISWKCYMQQIGCLTNDTMITIDKGNMLTKHHCYLLCCISETETRVLVDIK